MKYIKNFNDINESITIEVLDFDYKLEPENINENFVYEKDNKQVVKLTQDQQKRLSIINKEIQNYLNNINEFSGEWNNRTIIMEIEPTNHYITKFIRREVEGDQFENPGLHEGIDLIYNNKNLLAKYLAVGTIKNGQNVLIKVKTQSGFEMIIIIEKNHKKYKFKLKTQMKGIGRHYNANKADKDIKLHPNGPLKH